jgi:hypothetical protein
MDLERLYGGSFIDWEAVAGSWAKRTVSSRLLLFAARRYLLEDTPTPGAGRTRMLDPTPLPDEIRRAFASPPGPGEPASRRWGEFVDAAVAAELEVVPYGERPPSPASKRISGGGSSPGAKPCRAPTSPKTLAICPSRSFTQDEGCNRMIA